MQLVRALLNAGADTAAQQPDQDNATITYTPLGLARMLQESTEDALPRMKMIERILEEHDKGARAGKDEL